MDSDKVIKLLKIILIISLVVFVFTVTKYKTNDCQLCSFEIKEKELKIGSFLDYYYEECFNMKDELIIEINNDGGKK